jgi:hypothetical protein
VRIKTTGRLAVYAGALEPFIRIAVAPIMIVHAISVLQLPTKVA